MRRRIYLDRAKARQKYETMPHIDLDAPAAEFMLTLILATREQPYPESRAAVRGDA